MRTTVVTLLLALAACGRAPTDAVSVPESEIRPDAGYPEIDPVGDMLDAEEFPSSDAPRDVLGTETMETRALAIALADDVLDTDELRVGDGSREVLRVRFDQVGDVHVHIRALHQGVPVFGSEAIVHLDERGSSFGVTDDRLRDITVDAVPTLDEAAGIDAAVTASVGWDALTADPVADLLVLRHTDQDHLVWRVQLSRIDGTAATSLPVLFVDAHDGTVVSSFDNLQYASGTTDYDGTKSFNDLGAGGSRYLEDTTRNLGTYTYANTTWSLYYVQNPTTSWTSPQDRQGVSAHWAASVTLDYYASAHGRSGINGSDGPGYINSLTGSGGVQTIFVNYGSNYVNAFWNPLAGTVTIGDGDGVTSGPLTALDIMGHEITHGVITHEANLTYQNESGAMNESYADVFGAMVDQWAGASSADVYTIGEDAWTPATPGDALRYMSYPSSDGFSRDHYSTRYTGSGNNGGVHINNGIGNLAFYLASEGGSHPVSSLSVTTVNGIGNDKAAEIWYLALTGYMTSSTNFAGSRSALISAASALYGATEVAAIEDAWAEVGVGNPSGG